MHSPPSRKQSKHATQFVRVSVAPLPLHLVRALCGVLLGIVAIVCAAKFLSVWTAVLLATIAIPPGILLGNVWTQICKRYIVRLTHSIWPFSLLRAASRQMPVLFWLGIVGTALVGGSAYLLASLPAQEHLATWITSKHLIAELAVLYAIMASVAESVDVLFLYRAIIEQDSRRRVTQQLAQSFLEHYEYHKN